MGWQDYYMMAGCWTSPHHKLWKHLSKTNIMALHLYIFKNNNQISNSLDIKCFMTGEYQESFWDWNYGCSGPLTRQSSLRKPVQGNRKH